MTHPLLGYVGTILPSINCPRALDANATSKIIPTSKYICSSPTICSSGLRISIDICLMDTYMHQGQGSQFIDTCIMDSIHWKHPSWIHASYHGLDTCISDTCILESWPHRFTHERCIIDVEEDKEVVNLVWVTSEGREGWNQEARRAASKKSGPRGPLDF